MKSAVRRRARRGAARERPPRVLWQTAVCAALFVLLTALKLLLPGHMEQTRETLGQWLVRDADFAAAFSAVGRAVTGEDSLGEAYTAVFGAGGEDEAQPVSTAVSVFVPQRALPENAVEEARELGFSYAAPLSDAALTSAFGWREDPNGAGEAFHWGVDLAAPEGTEILCFADGTVGVVAESVLLGKYLTVQHANGAETLYAHCSAIGVSSGAEVKRGDVLGAVGSTGNATGAHLHFEVHDGAAYLDPAHYLSP